MKGAFRCSPTRAQHQRRRDGYFVPRLLGYPKARYL